MKTPATARPGWMPQAAAAPTTQRPAWMPEPPPIPRGVHADDYLAKGAPEHITLGQPQQALALGAAWQITKQCEQFRELLAGHVKPEVLQSILSLEGLIAALAHKIAGRSLR